MNISTRQSQDLDDIIFEFRQNDKTLSEKALWNNFFHNNKHCWTGASYQVEC